MAIKGETVKSVFEDIHLNYTYTSGYCNNSKNMKTAAYAATKFTLFCSIQDRLLFFLIHTTTKNIQTVYNA